MDKYMALKTGLEKLMENMQELIATGQYGEDEEMEKKDVNSVMQDVQEDIAEIPVSPIQEEMKNFMKFKNMGIRPKGLKAVMIEANVKKPMMGMEMGYKKGRK